VSNLRDLALRHKELSDKAKALEDELKEVKAQLEESHKAFFDAMVEEGAQMCNFDGYTFSLNPKPCASVPVEDREEFFQVLAEHGLGELVKPTLNQQTLNAEVKRQMEANDGELPDWMQPYVQVYIKRTVSMRKAR